MAERELAGFGKEAQENVRLCLFQAALLVAGKLALLDPDVVRQNYGTCLERCVRAAALSLKTPEDHANMENAQSAGA